MATAASDPDHSTKVMEDGLSCCICYNFLREPKDLDCPHVYCLQCLQGWSKKKSTIECPECRHITSVPQGGLVNLKTNFRLKTMVEDYVKFRDKRKDVPMCSNHDGEQQHFFCLTCGITVYHNCLVLEHPRPQHYIKELKVFTKTQKTEIKIKMGHVQEATERVNQQKQKLCEMKGKLKALKERAASEIKKRVQEIVAQVEGKGNQMMTLIERNYQQNWTTLQEEQNYMENKLSRLQNIHSRAQNVVDATSDHQFIQQKQSLVDQMDQLCLTHQSETSFLDWDSLQFKPGTGFRDMAWFGHVNAYSKETCKLPGSDRQEINLPGHVSGHGKRTCKLSSLSEFGIFQDANGVSCARTGQIAVVDFGKDVSIYQKDDVCFKHQYFLGFSRSNGNITRPFDVATTSDSKFLVSDDGEVKIFSAAGRYEGSWSRSVGANRITTTPDDMVIIGCRSKGVITVHQSNGEFIRTHQADCENIQDIASNGKQIAFTTGSQCKIYAIHFVTGQTLWVLDMVRPLGICYEQKLDMLLVAGGGTTKGEHVIEQYCSTTGRLISRLASGLYNPLAMTVTHDQKLVVANRKTVKIYQIDYN